MLDMSTPIASAQICVITVFAPCPMSTAPWNSAMRPSRRSPTLIVDGFGSAVFPQPYHMPARPTPLRIEPPSAFASAAAARARSQCGRSASRQSRYPIPESNT